MVYKLIIANISIVLLVFLTKLILSYFFAKKFNKTITLFRLFAVLLLYELLVFLFTFFHPEPTIILSPIVGIGDLILLFLLPLLFFVVIFEKFKILDWKKGLILFLLIFLINTFIFSHIINDLATPCFIPDSLAIFNLDPAMREVISSSFCLRTVEKAVSSTTLHYVAMRAVTLILSFQ